MRACGPHDATARLAVFRHGLPPVRSARATGPAGNDVAAKIERELDLLRATERELDLVRG